MIPEGNRRLQFTKHKGTTFTQVYNTHKYYMMWDLGLETPIGPMLDLQRYFFAREVIMDQPLPPRHTEYKPMFI